MAAKQTSDRVRIRASTVAKAELPVRFRKRPDLRHAQGEYAVGTWLSIRLKNSFQLHDADLSEDFSTAYSSTDKPPIILELVSPRLS